MTRGEELWQAAETGTKTGDLKSQQVLRMYALAQMLAASETPSSKTTCTRQPLACANSSAMPPCLRSCSTRHRRSHLTE
jgi:hypothetical protein